MRGRPWGPTGTVPFSDVKFLSGSVAAVATIFSRVTEGAGRPRILQGSVQPGVRFGPDFANRRRKICHTFHQKVFERGVFDLFCSKSLTRLARPLVPASREVQMFPAAKALTLTLTLLTVLTAQPVVSSDEAATSLTLDLKKGTELKYRVSREMSRSHDVERQLSLKVQTELNLTVVDSRPEGGWILQLRIPSIRAEALGSTKDTLSTSVPPVANESPVHRALRRFSWETIRFELSKNGEIVRMDPIDLEKLASPNTAHRDQASREITTVFLQLPGWIQSDLAWIFGSGASGKDFKRDTTAFHVQSTTREGGKPTVCSAVYGGRQRDTRGEKLVFTVQADGLLWAPGAGAQQPQSPSPEIGSAEYETGTGLLRVVKLEAAAKLKSATASGSFSGNDRVSIKRVWPK